MSQTIKLQDMYKCLEIDVALYYLIFGEKTGSQRYPAPHSFTEHCYQDFKSALNQH